MHAYRKFVQDEMDKRGWTAAELSRASGLSRQNLSRILNDDRDVLQRRPEPTTITSLSRAFQLSEDAVLSFVAEAMGFRSERVSVPDASALSDDELLRILAERLRKGSRDGDEDAAGLEREAQPDGVTPLVGGRRPRQEDYGRAADASGPSLLEVDDARAAARGEESQDPGSDEPA
ncbi:MAG TPA: helix-turn-helix domain-containing protein [Brachybacterium paraconglomeratum]|uniref:Helix-turn-helix domain-containing protein n=1 Tax=Brachybacterium paraconglomeratum TaxID=173362 RepID=A0A921KRW4_9MICO|nr:helix-turn-helix domain-containing protein [Brachybacterium paraconglomeratum]